MNAFTITNVLINGVVMGNNPGVFDRTLANTATIIGSNLQDVTLSLKLRKPDYLFAVSVPDPGTAAQHTDHFGIWQFDARLVFPPQPHCQPIMASLTVRVRHTGGFVQSYTFPVSFSKP